MLGSLGNRLYKQTADYESVDSRNGIRETGANPNRESVVSTLFRSESKGKRDRGQNDVHSSRDRENLHEIHERKAEMAVPGERMAQQRLYEAEAEVEARNWEKRNSDIAFQEINQEFECQRFQLQQANRLADQAQRDKISLYGELEFHENHARDCQAIEELRRICCEETNRARQARIDELSTYQERNPTTVRQLLTQIQELQNKVNPPADARERNDPESGSSSGADHRSQSTLHFSESQRCAQPRFCMAARYTEV